MRIRGTLFLMLVSLLGLRAQHNSVQFQQLSPMDGLSQGTITAMTQDSRGFLWFGTEDGLNRYDGYQFKTYYNEPNNPYSLTSSEINALAATKDGTLWVGTERGLNLYQTEYDRFQRIDTADGLPSLTINCLLAMPDGSVWIGTDKGLVHVCEKGEILEAYLGPPHLPANRVTSLVWEKPSVLWVGTDNGLVRIVDRPQGGRRLETVSDVPWAQQPIRALTTVSRNALYVGTDQGLYSLKSSQGGHAWVTQKIYDTGILSVGYDEGEDHLWVGSQDGLLRFHLPNMESPEYFEADNLDRNALTDNQIYSIYQSREGIWWFGASSGLNYFDPLAIKFGNFALVDNSGLNLVSNKVWTILPAPDAGVWLGTEAGLVYTSPEGELRRYKYDPAQPGSLQENRIRSLSYDPAGRLWVGTEYGLHRYNPTTETFTQYLFDDAIRGQRPTGNLVRAMWWRSPRELWCGTLNGIYIFDPVTGSTEIISPEPERPDGLQSGAVVFIYGDDEGEIWVGTEKGLHRRLEDNHTYEVFRHDPYDSTSLVNSNVRTILQDSKGRLWIGTKGGLDLKQENGFTHFGTKDGLPNHVIYSIVEDEQGRLWLSTNRGLSVFNVPQKSFRNFDVSDGLQGQEFNTRAAARTENGKLLFGGINGFNAFYPDSLAFNEYAPPTYIVNVDLYGEPVEIGSRTMPKSPLVLDTLRLTHRQDFLTIHFTGLSYTQSLKNQYQYRLAGFQDAWIDIGTNRSASFTNLPGGDYLFEVRASNNDLVYSEEPAQLVVLVSPPLWKTIWFQVLVGLGVFILGIALFQHRLKVIKQQKRTLEVLVAKRTAQIQEQATSLAKQAGELRKNYEEARTLADIGRQITSHIKGMDLVWFLYKQISGLMDTGILVVGLYNREKNRLDMLGVKAPETAIPYKRYGLEERNRPEVWSFLYQSPLLFSHFPKEYAEKIGKGKLPEVDGDMPQSVIFVPFFKEDKPIGIIGVQSFKKEAYSQFDFDFVRNLAAYIAIALDNSRAYYQIRKQKDEIEQMNASLERKVRERTRELLVQKNKLEEFAQINAHKVRRPLAAMMGLVPLLRWAKSEEQDNLLESLEVSSKELDDMVHRMNKILTEQGILSMEEITKETQES